LKVSRTIADLAASDDIKAEHLAELFNTGVLDREDGQGRHAKTYTTKAATIAVPRNYCIKPALMLP
jgi:hypothetical protein